MTNDHLRWPESPKLQIQLNKLNLIQHTEAKL
ncbi:hypothetical protein KR52_00215 [Synechococcus sp. KORDI-52]|nr:hypothetical protein KR52_00215 [Synechococcus sp. KORDI-52]